MINNVDENENLIKQAEENILKSCKELLDMLSICDALSYAGNEIFDAYLIDDKNLYFDGISNIRKALYNKYIHNISMAFTFCHSSKNLQEFSFERFKKYFNEEDHYTVAHFLEKYGNIPSSYKTILDKKLRKEAKELIEEKEK